MEEDDGQGVRGQVVNWGNLGRAVCLDSSWHPSAFAGKGTGKAPLT